MRYSEAIRLGAMLHPQVFRAMFRADIEGAITGTCANGGAAVASGFQGDDAISGCWHLSDKFPDVMRMMAACPKGCNQRAIYPILDICAHINDVHRWTRERIADFVEEVEAQHEAAKPVEECVAV